MILTRYRSGCCNYIPLDRLLGQLGIDMRQSGAHAQMREYIRLLEEELRMTKEFLQEEIDYARRRAAGNL